MPADAQADIQFEIGHVLFIDIVGYSTLLINEQSGQLETLKKIVRGTDQFRLAEAEGKLLRLPTGDGGALVFRTTPESPVLCALEISKELKNHPKLRVRMGIHSGPVNEISDLNEQANIAGAGINIAQRVMDCGDTGHILLSKHVADDLEQYPRWRAYLHELGECEVKHGTRVGVVNLYADQIGNRQLPKMFQALRKRRSRVRWAATVAALLGLAAIVGGVTLFSRTRGRSTVVVPEKSIAVLPFENLSGDPNNAYFTEGIEEEILTRLSKIADLKVISRISTQHFRSSPDNLPDIAKQLGVANVLEGSVQRSADEVRVNVQLVKAETATHLWADTFDRKLTDVFQIESDIAKTIAEKLQAKLTGSEERAISMKPTADVEAHQLYLKGRYLWNRRTGENLKKALAFFQQAAEKDPNYAFTYAGIADSCSLFPIYGVGAPQEYLPRARAAAEKALALDDSLAEAHASMGMVFFSNFQPAESAKEFERAIALNPNYATAHAWYGRTTLVMIGQLDRAMAEVKRAYELDPVSSIIHAELGSVNVAARRYDEAIQQLRATVEMDPEFYWAHRWLGMALELKGDTEGAIAEYKKALELNDDPAGLAFVAHAEASIGRQNEARALLAQLAEAAKKRFVQHYAFALTHLALGERDQALDWLEKGVQARGGSYLCFVKVDPFFDPVRGDPRFEAVVQKVAGAEHK